MPPPKGLEEFSRTLLHDGKEVVILRPGIALVLYSYADLTTVMSATADVLSAYLDFVPPGVIAATYRPGPDEYTPGRWIPFDSAARILLFGELRSGVWSEEDEGYSFVLTATRDGQAGDYGVALGGIHFTAEADEDEENAEDESSETSLLRLEFPSNLLATVDVALLVEFVQRMAALFPFCSGHAGMSLNHTIAYVPEATKEIYRLLPRLLGFDPAHDSAQLEMRGKSPPAHWLNLLDGNLVEVLGGEGKLRSELGGCELKSIGEGMLIRAAKFPPVVDVNRGGLDIGCLPIVARALKPIRFDKPMFVGFPDDVSGQAWLDRFDNLVARDWNNG
jgi:hypothetical protein